MADKLFSPPPPPPPHTWCVRATHVPVGDDQLQHLELARDLARSFNRTYEPVFPEPQPLLGETALHSL